MLAGPRHVVLKPPSYITAEFLASGGVLSTTSTYTFSSLSLGEADKDRVILVATLGNNTTATRTWNTSSIAGVNLEVIAGFVNTVTSFPSIYFYFAKVPTGTTGDLVIGWTGNQLRCYYALWSLRGVKSLVATSPFDTAQDNDLSVTLDTDIQPGGLIVACNYNSSSGTVSYTGLTTDFNMRGTIEGTTTWAGGVLTSKTFQNPASISATISAGSTRLSAAVAIA